MKIPYWIRFVFLGVLFVAVSTADFEAQERMKAERATHVASK